MRKEEKKAKKEWQASANLEDHASHLKSLGYNPDELWRER